jgi:hypothetical protein
MSTTRTITYEVDTKEMARRGRLGGLATASRHDSREITAPARRAFRDKFLIAVDPEGTLPVEERHRRAEAARKAFYARLAQLSVIARAKDRA